ncbi:ATP-binding protein [Flavobacterium cerinum]|uniref:4Fe-4S binding protein n=1 Tax=Flavobacterium cerinum TaxID=2502784 RepID=A0ABY5IQN0_9FLAO|nr:4Fe-4S binding protein [Flavobacterium cerinum]UUC44591.1 4Fe-4S binding protein [Flavobacterium cerinum]
MSRFIKVNSDLCTECTLCEPVCDVNAIKVGRKYISGGWEQDYFYIGANIAINHIICHSCWECVEICPTGAISINGSTNPGFGNGNSDGLPSFVIQNYSFFTQYNNSLLKEKMDGLELVNGIKGLNAVAVEKLVSSLGGELTTDAKYILKDPLGKIAAVGTVLQGISTIVAFSDGEITNEDWTNLGLTLLGAAGFIPGPIGLIATGISVGIAIYDSQNTN